MDVAAGEYRYDVGYFERMLAAEAVDVLRAETTRCGVTDGSTLPTQGAANPAMTIMALVAGVRRRDGRQGSSQSMLFTRGAQVTTEETLT